MMSCFLKTAREAPCAAGWSDNNECYWLGWIGYIVGYWLLALILCNLG